MKKTIKLTVGRYIEDRNKISYNKQIRILDHRTHENLGNWMSNADAVVKDVKITTKTLFIFV